MRTRKMRMVQTISKIPSSSQEEKEDDDDEMKNVEE